MESKGTHRHPKEDTASRPNIIIRNKKEEICVLLDVKISADTKTTQKEADKKTNTNIFELR